MNNDQPLSLVVVGHVDHGKSTVVGRILSDTDSLPTGKLEQVKSFCALNSRPFEYAFLLDTLKDEQSQGITIETTRIFFRSEKRRYMVLDAPGHIEFLRNMVTGASKAEAALLVIDAVEGIQENSKRHGVLLFLLGIKQVAVLVNKMDLVGYSEERFNEIKSEYANFLLGLGVMPVGFIPISATAGENLTQPARSMAWYTGPTVMDTVDQFKSHPPLDKQAFRMPVQDVYKFTRYQDDRRIVVGTVESGRVSVGDEIEFQPSGKRSKIKSIEDSPSPVVAGQAVGLILEDQIYLKRGEVACRPSERPIRTASRIRASVFWLGKTPLLSRRRYTFKIGTTRCEAELIEVHRVLKNTDLQLKDNSGVLSQGSGQTISVETNETAECTFDLDQVVAIETHDDHETLSRFVLFDGFHPAGGGVVRTLIEDPHRQTKDEIRQRNFKWDSSLISDQERHTRNQHPVSLILISGNPQAPRKELAKELERQLFDLGHAVYYLGFGNLLSGIAATVDRTHHDEQIRVASEVAQVFLNSGTILVMSLQQMSQADLQVMRMHLNGAVVKTYWMGSAGQTDLNPDLTLSAVDLNDESSLKNAAKMILSNLHADYLLRPSLT